MSEHSVEVQADTSRPGWRRWRPLILASLGSLLVGVLIGGLVEGLTSRPDSVLDRLSGFEEVPTPGLRGPVTEPTSYLLGTVDEIELVATIGDARDGDWMSGPIVCLTAIEFREGASTGSSWSSCAPREAFGMDGIWLAGSGPNRPTTTFYWPSDGPPGIVVCRPGDWPERC